jgi:hypothetical protein
MLWTPVRLKAAATKAKQTSERERQIANGVCERRDSAGYLELEAGAELSGERGGAWSELVNSPVPGRVVWIRYGRQ